jgi:hypothetical protein
MTLCKREYRPPRFPGGGGNNGGATRRITPAKVWIVGLREAELPEAERDRMARGEARARAMIRGHHQSTSHFWWPRRPAFASVLRPGDWVISALRRDDQSIVVSPPGQFLFLDSYPRAPGKRRYVFHLEVPREDAAIPWSQFRRAARRNASLALTPRPRTRAIRNLAAADALLRLWTSSGRPSKALRAN